MNGHVLHPGSAPMPASRPAPVLDVVVPVHNEESDLGAAVVRLHDYLTSRVPYGFRITIADNASTDATAAIADHLAATVPTVAVVHLPAKGRGGALRTVWSASDAQVLAYMDVDLSTDLSALLPLIAPLVSGHSDLAIGTRLHRSSRVVRGPKREFISRCYNLLLRGTLHARFSDAQCGFKAIRADVAAQLLPLVQDSDWFFDTELLVLAERSGLRIHEVPVDWVDDPDSRVDIPATVRADLRGVLRIGKALASGALPLAEIRAHLGRAPLAPEPAGVPKGMTGQAFRFAVIGAFSTLAYLGLFALLRPMMSAQPANLVAMIVTTVANTAANRRFTFAVHGRHGAARQQLQGLLLFAVSLGVTSGSLSLLHALHPAPGRVAELGVLLLANLVAGVGRFLLLRVWVFRDSRSGTAGGHPGATDDRPGAPEGSGPEFVPATIPDIPSAASEGADHDAPLALSVPAA
jgi:putative flippase GtrA